MNAERLSLDSASFDAVVSMSAFEHISDVTSAVCPRSSGFWFLVEALW
jgi:hypothetical protein